MSHWCAIIITSKWRTGNKNDSESIYMGEVDCVLRLFFYFVVLAVLIYWAYTNLWPSGLYVLKIKIIMWKNDANIQTAVILCCVLRCSIYRS